MSAYMIVEEHVTDPEGFQKYRQGGVATTIEHFGGKIRCLGWNG
jgi:uncharacterized protein (DUF1330 family)